MPRLKGFDYPREVNAYAVLAYHRSDLSKVDVEGMLSAQNVIFSQETVWLWVNRSGQNFFQIAPVWIDRDRTTMEVS